MGMRSKAGQAVCKALSPRPNEALPVQPLCQCVSICSLPGSKPVESPWREHIRLSMVLLSTKYGAGDTKSTGKWLGKRAIMTMKKPSDCSMLQLD